MFGYIKPFKPDMKIREYETYKAVYCGLCRQLGQSFGPLARLTLSYDFTFLCMLHYDISGEKPDFTDSRCCVNPLKKCKMCGASEAQRFSADIAALMLYYKLLDNIQDSGFLKRTGWRLLAPFAKKAHKKAAAARPEADAAIALAMERQRQVEERHSPSVDEAGEPSAAAMGAVCALLSEGPVEKRILQRLGYLVGRYVYLCDALDDMEKDLHTGNYNPFVLRHGVERAGDKQYGKAVEEAKGSILLTAGEIERDCALLDLKWFGSIVENVVCLGLRAGAEQIIAKKETSR